MKDKKLKACPFCGCAAKELQQEENGGDILHAVRCTNVMCVAFDIQPRYFSVADARKAWNARCEQ